MRKEIFAGNVRYRGVNRILLQEGNVPASKVVYKGYDGPTGNRWRSMMLREAVPSDDNEAEKVHKMRGIGYVPERKGRGQFQPEFAESCQLRLFEFVGILFVGG